MLKVLAALVAAAIIGTGIVVFSSRDSGTKQTTEQTQKPQNKPQTASGVGRYIDYSEDVIAGTEGQKILFFHAPWCPQCRALESDIKNGPIPNGVTIIKVDYDSMQDLRQKYGVTLQTTLVKVDDQGELLKRYVAYDEPTLDNLVKNLL